MSVLSERKKTHLVWKSFISKMQKNISEWNFRFWRSGLYKLLCSSVCKPAITVSSMTACRCCKYTFFLKTSIIFLLKINVHTYIYLYILDDVVTLSLYILKLYNLPKHEKPNAIDSFCGRCIEFGNAAKYQVRLRQAWGFLQQVLMMLSLGCYSMLLSVGTSICTE